METRKNVEEFSDSPIKGNDILEHSTGFKRFALITQPAAEQRGELSPTRGSGERWVTTRKISGAAEQRLIESDYRRNKS